MCIAHQSYEGGEAYVFFMSLLSINVCFIYDGQVFLLSFPLLLLHLILLFFVSNCSFADGGMISCSYRQLHQLFFQIFSVVGKVSFFVIML